MKYHLLALCIIILSLTGCMAVTKVIPPKPDQVCVEKYNKVARNREGVITLKNREIVTARSIRMTGDSLIWEKFAYDSLSAVCGQVRRGVSLHEVKTVVFKNRLTGAIHGLVLGGLLGMATGSAVALVMGEDPECSMPGIGVYICAVWIGLPVGLTTGAIAGTAVGFKQRYMIEEKE